MEFTIKKIISIDKNVEKFKKEMDRKINAEKEELEKVILSINDKAKMDIEEKKLNLMEEKIKNANEEVQKVTQENKKKLNIILKEFNEKEDNISEEIFNQIIASLEEE